MSRFRDELKVIPRTARIVAIFGFIAVNTLFFLLVTFGSQKDMADLPHVGKIFMMVFPGIFVAVWILLIGYVYGDAQRRGMRHVMWTLLAFFIPDGIGIIVYFILRDPLMKKCPGCGNRRSRDLRFARAAALRCSRRARIAGARWNWAGPIARIAGRSCPRERCKYARRKRRSQMRLGQPVLQCKGTACRALRSCDRRLCSGDRRGGRHRCCIPNDGGLKSAATTANPALSR